MGILKKIVSTVSNIAQAPIKAVIDNSGSLKKYDEKVERATGRGIASQAADPLDAEGFSDGRAINIKNLADPGSIGIAAPSKTLNVTGSIAAIWAGGAASGAFGGSGAAASGSGAAASGSVSSGFIPSLVKAGSALLLKPTVGPNGQVTGEGDLMDISHNYTYGYDDTTRMFDGNGNLITDYKMNPSVAVKSEPGMELSSGMIALVIIIGVALAAAHIRR